MDRGIKDEAFVRHALDIATAEDGRWVANQSGFNNAGDLAPAIKAALVTAVSIYVTKFNWPYEEIEAALQVRTVQDARALVDRLNDKVPL